MATFTETDVTVKIIVRRDPDGVHLIAEATSKTASGQIVRRDDWDITNQLSAARVQGATDLLADVEARVKALWEIT